MSYEKATIMSYLRKIHEKELVLPAIQRDFVWDEGHIYSLLDSIFRSYPFGTLLFWNTKQRIQYREFTLAWKDDQRYTYDVKEDGKKTTLVLDGQQRLQSLYIAIYGDLENKHLYFDLMSGDEPEDVSQAKYSFLFFTSNQAEIENKEKSGQVFWVRLSEISNLDTFGTMTAKTQHYLSRLKLSADSDNGMRLSNNVSTAYHSLKSDPVLNFYTVDKEYGDDGVITSQDEILEIFVRVNSGGQVLTKSDLMFSLMQLSWEGAADSIADLVERLNKKGHFNFDKDFILKCALVCVGEGAKYEVAKFRKETTIPKIKREFSRLARALENFVNFFVNTSRFLDDRIFRSYNTLIPFVFFFYQQPDQDIKGEDVHMVVNHAIYLSLMTAVYSRFADNYIDQVVKNILIPADKAQPGKFPVDQYRRFIYDKREKEDIDDWLLQNNLPLLMNILEKGRVLPDGERSRVPEYDHIFPKSKLPDHGYTKEQINHYANFRLIPAKDNNWKRNQDPKAYFKDFPAVMDYYLMPKGLLDYEQYPEFLRERRNLIWEKVRIFLGISERNETLQPDPQVSAGKKATPIENLEDLPDTEAIDEYTLIQRMLRRIPISYGQQRLYEELYRSEEKGMTNREIAHALDLTPYQFAGLMGALGHRIEATPGSDHFHGVGINLIFEITHSGDSWLYQLKPVFRQVLEELKIVHKTDANTM